MNFEAYFYLSTGFLSFLLLFFVLRSYALQDQLKEKNTTSQIPQWLTLEPLVLSSIIQESHNIKTFRFKRKHNPLFPAFYPGQFISFPIDNKKALSKVYRSYSISSSCENHSTLDISVKKIETGKGSLWLHSLKEGDTVWALPPSGNFTDSHLSPNTPRVFIAGGIGVTPFVSMILSAFDQDKKYPIYLFYGVRSKKDLAFHRLFTLIEKKFQNFNYTPILSNAEPHWHGKVGHITLNLINETLSPSSDLEYFICGPETLLENLLKDLKEIGVPLSKIHTEKFISPSHPDLKKIKPRSALIKYKNQKFKYHGTQNLLEFLESQGQKIPFSCRNGVCGNCKLKILKGSVHSLTTDGLKGEERNKYFLSCVSWPQEDLEIQ